MCRGWNIFETRSWWNIEHSDICFISCPLDTLTGANAASIAFTETSRWIWRQANYLGSSTERLLHCHVVSPRRRYLVWKPTVFLSQHRSSRKTDVRKTWTIGKSTSCRRQVNVWSSSRSCQLKASSDVWALFGGISSPSPPLHKIVDFPKMKNWKRGLPKVATPPSPESNDAPNIATSNVTCLLFKKQWK